MLDPIAGSLEHYMDLLSARQKLVASNIANAGHAGIPDQRPRLSSGVPEPASGRQPGRHGSDGAGNQARRQQRKPGPGGAAAGGERDTVQRRLKPDAGGDPPGAQRH